MMIKTFVFLLLAVNISGQVAVQSLSGENFLYKQNDDIKGSQFLFSDWVTASLTSVNGGVIENVQLNFDVVNDLILCKVKGGKYIKLDKHQYILIKLFSDGKIRMFENFASSGHPNFYEVIYSGEKLKFLKHEEKIRRTNNGSANSYNSVNAMYRYQDKVYYYISKDGNLDPVKRKEKDILKMLNAENQKSFIKKNKLKLKKDEDLIQLLAHIESS